MKKLFMLALAASIFGLSQTASAEWLYRKQWHTGYRTVVVPYKYATYQRYTKLRAKVRERIVYYFLPTG